MEAKNLKTLLKIGEEFDALLIKLHVLKTLEEGEKLSIYDNVLYIDGTWYPSIQPFTRLILNQGRIHIFTYLKTSFAKYERLVEDINDYDSFTCFDVELRRELLSKSKNFVNDSKMGLLVLKSTYSEYKELFGLINQFIEKMDKLHLGFSPKMKPITQDTL